MSIPTKAMTDETRRLTLADRLEQSAKRIGTMCSEGRGPKMRVPATPDDDDIFITTALREAAAALRSEVREYVSVPLLTPGESVRKRAAWTAFLKAMGSEMPVNSDGTYNGTFDHAIQEAIQAYLLAAPPAPNRDAEEMVSIKREHLQDGLNYIKHCGANAVMRGEPHPQQQIVDWLEAALAAAPDEDDISMPFSGSMERKV